MLNASRLHLVKQLNEGTLPYTKTSYHRRIKLGDLQDQLIIDAAHAHDGRDRALANR